ncbi:hypothetical protein QTN47_21270 [Danxiaibacter flavus]|uniref:GLPGLI family protein n=1 Tax=Danxiaibacter flavus TaxID=3049108 RepID=A0ABV3ZJN2_9BACT|nr:hypothetical protein QNM32_21275 [Chitinophagaceae bacterium DXS]
MQKIIILLFCLVSLNGLLAQRLSNENFQHLKVEEDTLKTLSKKMIFDIDATNRFQADSAFTRAFVRALRVPNSFNFPFDSVITISKLYPQDSSFRIFSWQYQKDEDHFRQRGAIQMKTADGSLKLFPLIDMSEFTANPTDSVRTPRNWIGAIYYGMVTKTAGNKKFYTLFGYDDNNIRSTKKWLDVLQFDDAGNPLFGGKFFDYKEDSLKPAQPAYRFCLEFKKDGRARMVYDEELDMIIFDHLISEQNDLSKKFTLIPDGDYEGFKWTNGKWVHVSKVFNQQLKDGEAPLPDPIKDDQGNNNEIKLEQRSLKNKAKKN